MRVKGPLASNDGTVITRWALDGLGIMVRSEWEAAPLISHGNLVRLLPEWRLEPAPIMALVPTRKGLSLRQRRFVETARAALDPAPWRRARKTDLSAYCPAALIAPAHLAISASTNLQRCWARRTIRNSPSTSGSQPRSVARVGEAVRRGAAPVRRKRLLFCHNRLCRNTGASHVDPL